MFQHLSSWNCGCKCQMLTISQSIPEPLSPGNNKLVKTLVSTDYQSNYLHYLSPVKIILTTTYIPLYAYYSCNVHIEQENYQSQCGLVLQCSDQ